jgi:hypothetical protein
VHGIKPSFTQAAGGRAGQTLVQEELQTGLGSSTTLSSRTAAA